MTLFLDTEFNSFGGALISIALVSDKGGKGSEFYAVLDLPPDLHPWVEQHVVPVLGRAPQTRAIVRRRLIEFLSRHTGEIVVADWPEDLMHLLRLLGGGERQHPLRLDMQLVSDAQTEPKIPHNALSDARALRDWHAKLVGHDLVRRRRSKRP